MNTTRNRSAVLAKFLRAATCDLRRVARRVDAAAETTRANALASIDTVAEALEAVAATPDPEGQG